MEGTRTGIEAQLGAFRRGYRWLVALIHDPLDFGSGGALTPRRFLSRQLRVIVQVFRQMNKDRCFAQASSLAYKSILSLVPTVAVALSLLKAFGAFSGPDSPVVRFVAGLVMPPNEATMLASKIIEFTSRISFGAIGGVGMTFLVLVAVSLLDTVDETINVIWKVKRQRSVFFRFTTFYTLLTLGPLLLTVSLLQSARLQGLFPSTIAAKTLSFATPYLVTWLTLLLSYKLFPNTRVHWKPAMVGALIAAAIIELVKFAFNVFISESLSTNYTTIYGALALIPLFLVWIYTLWTIVLFGVEYSYTVQNLGVLTHQRNVARSKARGLPPEEMQVGEELGCRVLAYVGRKFERGDRPPTKGHLVAQLGAEPRAVDMVVNRLAHLGFLRVHAEYGDGGVERELLYPGRSPNKIRLKDVVGGFRSARHQGSELEEPNPRLERWLEELDLLLDTALSDISLADVIGGQEQRLDRLALTAGSEAGSEEAEEPQAPPTRSASN